MQVTGGDTNVVAYFMVRLVADGTAATALTVTNFDLQYTRTLTAAATKIDGIVGTGGATTHVDDKVFEINATSSPGLYMACFPDAAFAAGVPQVMLELTNSTDSAFAETIACDIDPPVILANNTLHGGSSTRVTLDRLTIAAGTTATAAVTITGNTSGAAIVLQGGSTSEGLLSTGGANANGVTLSGGATTGDALGLTVPGTGVFIENGTIVAATFGAGAIDAAAIATDAVDADALATDALTEIQASCDAALVANDLDHLTKVGAAPTVAAGSYLDVIQDDGTATYDRTTDSLQAIRDNGGGSVTLANGVTHGGSTAVLQCERIVIASTTSGQPGIHCTGNGAGAGAQFIGGGASGHGLNLDGGLPNGVGMSAVGEGSGAGCNLFGEQVSGTGPGLRLQGGGTSGSCLVAVSTGTNDPGIEIAGLGSGAGVSITAGATGDAIALAAAGGDLIQASTIVAGTFAAGAIDANAIAADAIGSSELATTAVNEIRNSILSDSTPFAGANIDEAISAAKTLADGAHGGSATVLTFDRMIGVSTSGDCVSLTGLTTGSGLSATGGATGNGVSLTTGAGATGSALKCVVNATNGSAIDAIGNGSGAGMLLAGGTSGHGLSSVGTGVGKGASFLGGATGSGVAITGGSSSGTALLIQADGTNDHGVEVVGIGTGSGISSTGGATDGSGILATGGATNGVALALTGTGTGDGLFCQGGSGASGAQIFSNGGNAPGLAITGNGSGNGLDLGGGATGDGLHLSGGGTSGDGMSFSVQDAGNPPNQLVPGAVYGTVTDAGASATSFDTSLTEAVDDFYKDQVLVFLDGNLEGEKCRITVYDGTGTVGDVTIGAGDLTAAPSNGSAFYVTGRATA